MKHLGIQSVSYRLPSGRFKISDLVNSGRISRGEYLAVGVESVPVIEENQSILELAAEASREALETADVSNKDVDLLVFFSSTHQNISSLSPAAEMQCDLELDAQILGITNVHCAGFHCALDVVRGIMSSRPSCQVALLVGADVHRTRHIPTGVFLSDGVSAVVVSRDWPVNRVMTTVWKTFGQNHDLFSIDQDTGEYRVTNPNRMEEFVRKKVLYRNMLDVTCDALAALNIGRDDIRYFVFESYGQLFQAKAAAALEVPVDRLFLGDQRHRGHTSSSDIVINYSRLLAEKPLEGGDKVLLFSIGIKHTWACSIIER